MPSVRRAGLGPAVNPVLHKKNASFLKLWSHSLWGAVGHVALGCVLLLSMCCPQEPRFVKLGTLGPAGSRWRGLGVDGGMTVVVMVLTTIEATSCSVSPATICQELWLSTSTQMCLWPSLPLWSYLDPPIWRSPALCFHSPLFFLLSKVSYVL